MWLVSNTIILRMNSVFSVTYNVDEANRDRIDVCYHNPFKSVAEQCDTSSPPKAQLAPRLVTISRTCFIMQTRPCN